jgi:hypothetical protein
VSVTTHLSPYLSPYVPTPAPFMERLIPLLEPYLRDTTTGLVTTTNKDPQFVDIGSGDGRVCVTVSKHFTCHSLGIDVTDLCTNR